jgi:hypothetical protein
MVFVSAVEKRESLFEKKKRERERKEKYFPRAA